jgi:hypothetical protein
MVGDTRASGKKGISMEEGGIRIRRERRRRACGMRGRG